MQCRRLGRNLAVTQWPMIAAPRARSGGTHESTPQDHEYVVPEHAPCVAREPLATDTRDGANFRDQHGNYIVAAHRARFANIVVARPKAFQYPEYSLMPNKTPITVAHG